MPISSWVDEVHTRLAGLQVGVGKHLGAKWVSSHETRPPRIVWVPVRETFGPADGPGGRPRQLRSRLCCLEAHLWEADVAGVEQLLHNLVIAIHRSTVGSYKLTGGKWSSEDGGAWQAKGAAYVLSLDLAFAITDVPLQTATIVTAEAPADVELPAGSVPAASK